MFVPKLWTDKALRPALCGQISFGSVLLSRNDPRTLAALVSFSSAKCFSSLLRFIPEFYTVCCTILRAFGWFLKRNNHIPKYILYQKSLQKFSGAISICIIFFYTNSISLITILFSQCVFTLVILIRTACATTGSASGTKTVSPASLSPAEVHGIVYSTPSSAQAPV